MDKTEARWKELIGALPRPSHPGVFGESLLSLLLLLPPCGLSGKPPNPLVPILAASHVRAGIAAIKDEQDPIRFLVGLLNQRPEIATDLLAEAASPIQALPVPKSWASSPSNWCQLQASGSANKAFSNLLLAV